MKRILLLGLAALCSSAQASAAETKTKIVLIGHPLDHPYASHMYLHECGLLAKCLQQTPDVEAVVSDGWPKDPAVLKDAKALVFYTSPGGNILLDPSHREQAETLLNGGVGFVAIHWATDCKAEWGTNYLQILGGWFNTSFSGLKTTNTRVEQTRPAHRICRGWKDFDLHEEIYLDIRLQPKAQPLIKVRVDDKEQIVGWVYERPDANGGRSFGTTLGHFHENFGVEPFRRLVVNGILWAAHHEVPASGAPCQINAKDMELPPDPRVKK